MAFEAQEWVDLATEMLGSEGAEWAVTRPSVVTRTSAGEVATPEQIGSLVGVASRYTKFQIDGKSIITGDVKFISDVSTWVMEIDDRINIAGVVYRCVDPGLVAPDGQPVVSICQFRRLGV